MGHGSTRTGRPALHLVTPPDGARGDAQPSVSFCSHCGRSAELTDGSTPRSRVCSSCELGLLLQSAADVAPRPGDPFVIVDRSLSICGLSGSAERLLSACETHVVNRHITELLVPAEAQARSRENLAVAITWAARGEGHTHRVVVRPARTFGVRLTARIGSCGPPLAALLVLE